MFNDLYFLFKDGIGRFQRSLLDGGLGFGISRERRQVDVRCRDGSYASTQIWGGNTNIQCLPITTIWCNKAINVTCK